MLAGSIILTLANVGLLDTSIASNVLSLGVDHIEEHVHLFDLVVRVLETYPLYQTGPYLNFPVFNWSVFKNLL